MGPLSLRADVSGRLTEVHLGEIPGPDATSGPGRGARDTPSFGRGGSTIGGVLRGSAPLFRSSPGDGGVPVPAPGVGRAPQDPVRHHGELRPRGGATGKGRSARAVGTRQCPEPHRHHRPVPPGHRVVGSTDGIRRGPAGQATPSGPRGPGTPSTVPANQSSGLVLSSSVSRTAMAVPTRPRRWPRWQNRGARSRGPTRTVSHGHVVSAATNTNVITDPRRRACGFDARSWERPRRPRIDHRHVIAIGPSPGQLKGRPAVRAWRRCPRGPRTRRLDSSSQQVPPHSDIRENEQQSRRDGVGRAGRGGNRRRFERVCATTTAMAICGTVEYLAVAQMPRRWSRKLHGTLLRRGYQLPGRGTRSRAMDPPRRPCADSATREPHRTWTQTMIPRRCPKCQHLVEEAKLQGQGSLDEPALGSGRAERRVTGVVPVTTDRFHRVASVPVQSAPPYRPVDLFLRPSATTTRPTSPPH